MLAQKAKTNLFVAKYCYIEGKKGETSYFSVSTSRAYYAAFQAAIAFFEESNFLEKGDYNDGEVSIRHKKMHEKIKDFLKERNASKKDYESASVKYNALRQQRIIADYYRDNISEKSAWENIKEAENIINILRKYVP